MIDRDKVLKGLECCIKRDPDDKMRCGECPYEGACLNRLKADALALLKAQEPKPVKRWNTKEASPYCPNIDACGRLLEEGWAYCPYCGQAVKWE